jgi:hypothetical protein
MLNCPNCKAVTVDAGATLDPLADDEVLLGADALAPVRDLTVADPVAIVPVAVLVAAVVSALTLFAVLPAADFDEGFSSPLLLWLEPELDAGSVACCCVRFFPLGSLVFGALVFAALVFGALVFVALAFVALAFVTFVLVALAGLALAGLCDWALTGLALAGLALAGLCDWALAGLALAGLALAGLALAGLALLVLRGSALVAFCGFAPVDFVSVADPALVCTARDVESVAADCCEPATPALAGWEARIIVAPTTKPRTEHTTPWRRARSDLDADKATSRTKWRGSANHRRA